MRGPGRPRSAVSDARELTLPAISRRTRPATSERAEDHRCDSGAAGHRAHPQSPRAACPGPAARLGAASGLTGLHVRPHLSLPERFDSKGRGAGMHPGFAGCSLPRGRADRPAGDTPKTAHTRRFGRWRLNDLCAIRRSRPSQVDRHAKCLTEEQAFASHCRRPAGLRNDVDRLELLPRVPADLAGDEDDASGQTAVSVTSAVALVFGNRPAPA